MTEFPTTVYLDQLHWVSLAKANTGHPEGAQFIPVLEHLREMRTVETVICPLSSTHYMEMHGNRKFRQRSDVAAVMAELSGFYTLSGIGPLRRAELDRALFRRFGRPDPPRQTKPIGWGVQFAFSGNLQEIRLRGPSEPGSTVQFVAESVS